MKIASVEVPPAPACREECRLVLHLRDGAVVGLESLPGAIPCPACLAAMRLVGGDEERIVAPHRPRRSKHAAADGRDFDRCSWDEAFEVLTRGLSAVSRGESQLVHVDLSERTSWSHCLVERFAELCGDATLVRAFDHPFERWVRELVEPTPEAAGPEDFDLLVAWGADPLGGPFARDAAIAEAVRGGTELWAVDVRASRTARAAAARIHVRPGTDTALALGMLSKLGERGAGGVPRAWLAALESWDDALVERTTGVAPIDALRFAEHLADAGRALIVVGRGVLERGNGRETLRAIGAVASVVGARIAVPWLGVDVTARARRPPVASNIRRVALEELAAVVADRHPRDDVLIIDGGIPWARPVVQSGGLAEYARAASLSVVVAARWAQEPFPADLVLPAPLFHEEATVVGRGGDPLPMRTEVEAAAPVDVLSRARVWRRAARASGLALEWFPERPEELADGETTAGIGRADSADAVPTYLPVVPSGELPALEARGDGPTTTPDLARAFGLDLVVVRDVPRDGAAAIARLSPVDASARGLADGEPVVVHNERGQVEASAFVDSGAPPRVVTLSLPEEGEALAGVERLLPSAGPTRMAFVDPCLVEVSRRDE